MGSSPDPYDIAAALRVSIGLFVRELRKVQGEGGLSMPETSALARLDRNGPTTPGELAKEEQISPQSVGATLAALEERRLVERRSDPADGRRVVMSLTEAGRETLRNRRSVRDEHIARALVAEFTGSEMKQLMAAAPLIERLAQHI